MNRTPFTLVDSRGTTTRLSWWPNHHQRKGASDDLCRIGCERRAHCGVCGDGAQALCVRGRGRADLRGLIQQLSGGAKLVAFEAGNQMKWIAETLQRLPDVQVHVVHPNEVKMRG